MQALICQSEEFQCAAHGACSAGAGAGIVVRVASAGRPFNTVTVSKLTVMTWARRLRRRPYSLSGVGSAIDFAGGAGTLVAGLADGAVSLRK